MNHFPEVNHSPVLKSPNNRAIMVFENAGSKNEVVERNPILGQIAERETEHFLRSGLLVHTRAFRAEVLIESIAFQKAIRELEALHEIQNVHPWRIQIETLKKQLGFFEGMEKSLGEVFDAVKSMPFKLADREANHLRCWKWLDRLHREDCRFRYFGTRVQGPKVGSENYIISAQNAQGKFNLAINKIVDYFSKDAAEHGSWCFNNTPWRFFDPVNNALWLYFHNDVDKFKCMFFRIGISKSAGAIILSLRAHVPFGPAFGDPAAYELESSQVYKRRGWFTTAVGTETTSITDTVSINDTVTKNSGETVGENISENEGESLSKAKSRSKTTSLGESYQQTDTANWNNSWSYNNTYSNINSYSEGNSQGHGGGESVTNGKQFNEADQEGDTDTVGTNYSKTVGINKSTNHGVALSKMSGISAAKGRSFQTAEFSWGLAAGKPNGDHIIKWKDAYPEEGECYDSVISVFQNICKQLEIDLSNSSRGTKELTREQLIINVGNMIPLSANSGSLDHFKIK